MKLNSLVCIVALVGLIAGCSSAKKLDTVDRNYKVVDRNPDPVPEWVEGANEYQESHKGFRYYVGESGSVSDRIAGCELAKMKGNQKIAQEVATYIDGKAAAFTGGQLKVDENNPINPGTASHFAELLKTKTMAMLHNVKEEGHFWEKRQMKDSKDSYYYECQMFLRISDTDLNQLVKSAANVAPSLIENPEAKKEVMNALHDTDASSMPHNM